MSDDDGMVVYYSGEAAKALPEGVVTGRLIVFSGPDAPDMVGDYFTRDSWLADEWPVKSPIYLMHGLGKAGRKRLGRADLLLDEEGVRVAGKLDLRSPIARETYEQVRAGKMGWSSGTATHLTERKQVGGAKEILAWPLGLDASLVDQPCEPRCRAVALKSLVFEDGAAEEPVLEYGSNVMAF